MALTNDTAGEVTPVSGTVSSTQGSANTAANGWPVKVTDGSNVAAVKAESTAAVATDTALVVTVSPNNSIKNADSIGNAQYNFPAGFVRTTDEPRQLFYDPFDSSLDTTNRWNAATVSGGGVAAAVASGNLTIGSGTTGSGWSKLTSQPTFAPTIPAWLGTSYAIKIENPVTANGYRFWGNGTIATSPTTAAPMTDAYGFEIDTAGKLYAVVYASGVRTQVADLSSGGTAKQPTDANFHRYIIYYRTDKIYFYIDTLDTPVATANFVGPNIQTLTNAMVCVAGSTPPVSSVVITCAGLAVWDTGKNNTTLSDGTFGWRKATVSSGGALSVQDTATGATAATAPTRATLSGGVFNTSPATITNGQMGQLQLDSTQNLLVKVQSAPSTAVTNAGTFAVQAALNADGPVTAGTVASKSLLTGGQFNTSLPTLTAAQQAATQMDSSGRIIVTAAPLDGAKPSFSAAKNGLVPATTATDIFTITGSASKTIRITKIRISGTQTTAGQVLFVIAKRSTANSLGTSGAVTAVAHDSNDTATATVLAYTANPTTGTLVGNLRADTIFIPAAATASGPAEFVYEFGNRPSKAIVLRGTGQVLAVNLNSVTVTGGSLNIMVEWTEE